VGRLLGARLPERAVRIGAAISFFVFAAIKLIENL
jgi:putative Ca2+/H+ antiporter (TMEM165/GDT1 family)